MHLAPWLAPHIVRAEQRRHGNWTPLTAGQHAAIGRVLHHDRHGHLTRGDAIARLHHIAEVTP